MATIPKLVLRYRLVNERKKRVPISWIRARRRRGLTLIELLFWFAAVVGWVAFVVLP